MLIFVVLSERCHYSITKTTVCELLSVLPTLYHQIGTTEHKGKLVTISEGSIKDLKGKDGVLNRTDICLRSSFFFFLLLLLLLVVVVVVAAAVVAVMAHSSKTLIKMSLRLPSIVSLKSIILKIHFLMLVH
jgi:hypothetical protein